MEHFCRMSGILFRKWVSLKFYLALTYLDSTSIYFYDFVLIIRLDAQSFDRGNLILSVLLKTDFCMS